LHFLKKEGKKNKRGGVEMTGLEVRKRCVEATKSQTLEVDGLMLLSKLWIIRSLLSLTTGEPEYDLNGPMAEAICGGMLDDVFHSKIVYTAYLKYLKYKKMRGILDLEIPLDFFAKISASKS
jgi:hypothetical protein